MYFSSSSLEKLASCHPDLELILTLALHRSAVDFGISEGHRSLERQMQMYREKKSTIDGVSRKGNHNYLPSLAADVFAYHPDRATRQKISFDRVHLAHIAGIVTACAEELLEKGEITHKIRWGGNWDGDGIIGFDQNFDDFPHFEIIPV